MNREQAWLLPPSLDELVPLDHPARFVAEFADVLDREDWKELGVEIEGDPLGAPSYHPGALLSVWLYGFMTGIRSSRKLEAAAATRYPFCGLPDGYIRTTTPSGGSTRVIAKVCGSCSGEQRGLRWPWT